MPPLTPHTITYPIPCQYSMAYEYVLMLSGGYDGGNQEAAVSEPLRPEVIQISHGQKYPAEIREMAYQLWAFKHSRNAAAVVKELKARAPSLDYDTVHRWAKVDNWPERVRSDLVAIAPDITQSIITDLIAGAAEGVATVRSIARGDLQTDPTRLQASIALLDRAGFGPRKDNGPLEPPRPKSGKQLPPTTDPDELQRRMQALIEKSRQR